MTTDTLQWGTFELTSLVAGHTRGLRMLSRKREKRPLVIKPRHAVESIVTSETAVPKIRHVLNHKSPLLLPVAIKASLVISLKLVSQVALLALQGSRVVIHLVPGEIEASIGVVKAIKCCHGRVKIHPFVVGMAFKTAVDRLQPGMETILCGHLIPDPGVAVETQRTLLRPQRLVAPATGLDFGMRGYAPQLETWTRLGCERPRVKHLSTRAPQSQRKENHKDHRQDDPSGR